MTQKISWPQNSNTVYSQAEAPVTIQKIRFFVFKVSNTNMPHIFFRNKTFLFVKIERFRR